MKSSLRCVLVALLPAVTAFAQTLPDLRVDSVTISPSSPVSGQSITITASLHNYGPVGTGLISIPVRFQVDGNTVGTEYLSLGLGGGSVNSENVTVTAPTAIGLHTAHVYVDSTNVVPESNENNNTKTQQFSVVAPPVDLIVQSVTINPSSPYAGQQITISAVLRNQGTVGTGAVSIPVRFQVDGVTVGTEYLSLGLGAGASNTESVTVAAPTAIGSHTAHVYVDSTNVVLESNENNNTMTQQFSVVAPPVDLIVQSVSINPASPYAGQQFTISAMLRNQGTVGTGAVSIPVRFQFDDVTVGTEYLSLGLGAGASNTESVTVTAPTAIGSHTAHVYVDSTNVVLESNENNNTMTQQFSVVAPPVDLIVQSVTINPASPYAGQQFTISAILKNQGTMGTGIVSIPVDFRVGGVLVGTEYLTLGLGAGASNTENVTIASGVLRLSVGSCQTPGYSNVY